jgi:hypothetical protein
MHARHQYRIHKPVSDYYRADRITQQVGYRESWGPLIPFGHTVTIAVFLDDEPQPFDEFDVVGTRVAPMPPPKPAT